MKSLLILSFFVFANTFVHIGATETISDERISEISERLESYNSDALIERRDFLLSYQEGDDENDNNGVPAGSSSERAIEISIIEALLVALGAIILDNVTEDATTPPDTVFPVITILGDNPATVELGDTYVDAGATSDGGETVTSSGTVDTSTVGTYSITYTASDAAGNTTTVTRTVNVVDTTPPTIIITGDNPLTVELGDTYVELGASSQDASDPDITDTASGTVDTSTVGTYYITYSATDASGNTGSAVRTVYVVDTTAPVFTSSATFSAVENQTAIGTVTATDLQTVTFTVSGSELEITTGGVLTFASAPDFETKTSYTATVTATDASSNSSTQDITVNVTNDTSDDDDDDGTGTGTGSGTSTGTGTGTGTGT
jgi:hypothetical protein|tara:strand:+ start:240 stop:1364 length:1125 start_codon:yes stop_codon:yes gene_type:complete